MSEKVYCLMCDLVVRPHDEIEKNKDGEVYHKICWDIAVANLEGILEAQDHPFSTPLPTNRQEGL